MVLARRLRPAPPTVVPLQALVVPLALLTAALVLLVPWGETAQPARTTGTLALAVASFVLLLNGRGWLVAPLLVLQFSDSDYIVPFLGLSARLALVLVSTALLIPAIFAADTLRDGMFWRMLVPGLAFVVLATLGNMLHSDADYVFKYFRFQVAQVLALVLVAVAPRGRRDLLAVAAAILLLASLAAAGARQWVDESGRAAGFGTSPVSFANQVAFVLLPLLGMLIVGPLRRHRLHALFLVAAAVLLYGLYASQTRSGLLAVAAGVATIGLYLKGERRTVVLGLVIAGVVLFNVLDSAGLLAERFSDTTGESAESAASHNALLQAGLAIALDDALLGIGHEQFEVVSADYARAVSPDAELGAAALGLDRPHDDFLSVWTSWGIAALLAYGWMYAATLVSLAVAARSRDASIRGLAIGSAGGVVAYGVGSAFHNYLDSSIFLWVYAGLAVALVRIGARPTQRRNVVWIARTRPSLRRRIMAARQGAVRV